MHAAHDLEILIRSRYPLVCIDSADEAHVIDVLRSAARSLGASLFTWSVLDGLVRDGAAAPLYDTLRADKALANVATLEGPGIYYFKDLERFLDDPTVLRMTLDLLAPLSDDKRALIVAGPDVELPSELKPFCASTSLDTPSRDAIADLARTTLERLGKRHDVAVHIDARLFPRVVDRLVGMSLFEAERLLMRLALHDRRFDEEDIEELLRKKKHSLSQDGVLELSVSDAPPALAGLGALTTWLERRGLGFSRRAKDFGIEPPRGVMLLGVQGCGKSLAARWVASSWNMPLLELDVASLYDKFIGETEKRLERALETAERLAPCVVLIDEIEKALQTTSGSEDGGLSRRIQGRLLTWLQDRGAPVFVVATCNDVSSLPPEMMRKGRFDEVFFVDLPESGDRREIFAVHLQKRGRDPAGFDLWALATAAQGFSGAEIEEAIVAALYSAFAEGVDLATRHVMAEIAATRPLSVMRREDVDALRRWASGRTVSANSREPAA